MASEFGTTKFRIPLYLREGTGVNFTQDTNEPTLVVNVSEDVIDELLGSSVVTTDYKQSVRVATDATEGNITAFGLQTIQGVALDDGDRVLFTAQTTASGNRVKVVRSGGWEDAEDFDPLTATISGGAVVPIDEGDNGGKIAVLETADPITLGTTSLTWNILESSEAFQTNFIGRAVGTATATLGLSYAKNWVFLTRAGTQTITIPTNASVPHQVGTEIIVQMIGTGTKTITIAGANTLNGSAGGSISITNSRDA